MARSKVGVAVASVVTGAAVLVLGGFALASATPHQTALQCVKSTTQAHTCSISLSTFPDSLEGVHGSTGGPHPDWVTYSNDNIDVPANTTVDVTIDQYDSGGQLNNDYFSNIIGTNGGFATYNGVSKTHIPGDNIGHTFTLHAIPGNGKYLFVSVPLPANNAEEMPIHEDTGVYPKPIVVKFSFTTGGATVYEWNCEFPCGGSREGNGFGEAMSTFGYMSGTITVQ
ncbi:MAG TPA: hypothetical protein VGG21_04035 [Acidimicrobiales bacterium]|jgi:hypothetical protein